MSDLDLQDRERASTNIDRHDADVARRDAPYRRNVLPPETLPGLVHEADEHPGRIDGGKEAMLRPKPTAVPLSRPEAIAMHVYAAKRGELYAAAHAARIAHANVVVLHAAAKPDAVVQAARDGVLAAGRHLAAVGSVDGSHDQGLQTAFGDAWANCMELVLAMRTMLPASKERDFEATRFEQRLLDLGVPHGWKPSWHAASASARTEVDSLHLPITAPLDEARLHLEGALDNIVHAMTTTDPSAVSIEDQQSQFLGRAAERAARLVGRAMSTAQRDAANPRQPEIEMAIRRYLQVAQQFADWESSGPGAAVVAASLPLATWSKQPAVRAAAPKSETTATKGQQFGQDRGLEEAWNLAFKLQHHALSTLATNPEPAAEPPWDAQLCSTIIQLGLTTLIGSAAGAAGAFVGAFASGQRQRAIENRREPFVASPGLEGAFSNGVETLVGSLLTQLVEQKVHATPPGAARKRFFDSQAEVILELQATLHTKLTTIASLVASHRPDGIEVLKRVRHNVERCATGIAAAQRQRAVQDWAVYLARTAHGTDERSNGVDMVGVGSSKPVDQTRPLERRTPTGVLELELNTARGGPSLVTRAVAGGLRADDVVHLEGLRIADVRMPIQFHITHRAIGEWRPETRFVVSRNEVGVLWLRSVDPESRQAIVRDYGGDARSDHDVLRAAAHLLETANGLRLHAVVAS